MSNHKSLPNTVQELSNLVSCTTDEVLLKLWYAGLFYLEDNPNARIKKIDLPAAFAALEISATRPAPEKRIKWWLDFLGLSREEFNHVLKELNCEASPSSRNIPKGAFKKLEKRYREELVEKFALKAPQSEELETRPSLEVTHTNKIPGPDENIVIGTKVSIKYLSTIDVERIHVALEQEFAESEDPISPPGVREFNLLDSAVNRPQIAGQKYPTIEMAGAALVHALIKNHPFHNGNKRTGLVALLVMLDSNGLKLISDEATFFKFAYDVAASTILEHPKEHYELFHDHEVIAIAKWIKQHSTPVAGYAKARSIQWSNLRQILTDYDCEFEMKGNVCHITRIDPLSSSRVFFKRSKKLSATIENPNGYKEIDRGIVQTVRKKLKLDSDYVSNGDFFSNKKYATAGFIMEYSKVLKRLAKL